MSRRVEQLQDRAHQLIGDVVGVVDTQFVLTNKLWCFYSLSQQGALL
jgi:hypothetical protein